MTRTVILKQNSDNDSLQWLELDEQGSATQALQEDNLEGLYKAAQGAYVTAIVPGIDVTLTAVNLPKLSPSKQAKAIPFALEDKLADKVKNLHFATKPSKTGHNTPVAVTSHAQMKDWLTLLSKNIPNSKAQLKVLLPETLTLPLEAQCWTVALRKKDSLIRTGQFSGFAADTENLLHILEYLLEAQDTRPKKIILLSDDPNSEMIETIKKLNIEISVKNISGSWLQLMSKQCVGDDKLNLLTGDYQPKSAKDDKKLLNYAGILVGAWLFVLTVGVLFQYNSLSSQNEEASQEITALYKDLFPQATSVINPKARLERLLTQKSRTQQASKFSHMINTIAPIIQKVEGVKVKEANFNGKQLQLQVEARDFTQLDNLTQRFKTLGITYEQSGATKSGGSIQSRIIIKAL